MAKQWDDFYECTDEIGPEECLSAGQFETYGKDLARLQEIFAETPNRIWTVLEGDDDRMWIVPGFRWVNRLYHVVSTEDCTDMSQEYRWDF